MDFLSKHKQDKENKCFDPWATENSDFNANRCALNLPDRLWMSVPNLTAKTPRRQSTPPRRQESSHTPIILNWLWKSPQNGIRRSDEAMVGSLLHVAVRKKAQLMCRQSAAPRLIGYMFQQTWVFVSTSTPPLASVCCRRRGNTDSAAVWNHPHISCCDSKGQEGFQRIRNSLGILGIINQKRLC